MIRMTAWCAAETGGAALGDMVYDHDTLTHWTPSGLGVFGVMGLAGVLGGRRKRQEGGSMDSISLSGVFTRERH
jgi:hypothetical protein